MGAIDFSWSATETAELLRRKVISSRELTAALFDRIEAVNPPINAVVEVRREQAMREALAADEATASQAEIGPLHGVPMTIKDSFNVAGLHTTWGNPAFSDYIAPQDATVVRRLQRAGAIVIGKTNVHFMLSDYGQTANEIYGVTSNPWDLDRSPGGSTGGGAAAVAAGLSYLEYGSDLVGSIRIPASFCGVYGLKPSAEIVPLTGFQPPGPPAETSRFRYQSSVGPLGRSATDLRTALIATAGPEAPDSAGYSWRLAEPRHRRTADFRIGVVLDHQRAPVASDVLAVLSDAVETLKQAGATIVEGWPAGIDPVADYESFGFQVGLFFAFQDPEQEFAPFSEIARQESRQAALDCRVGQLFRRRGRLPLPGDVHDCVPARRPPVRRSVDRHCRWGAPVRRSTVLDLACLTGRAARGGGAGRDDRRRTAGRVADRRTAVRGRHRDHVC